MPNDRLRRAASFVTGMETLHGTEGMKKAYQNMVENMAANVVKNTQDIDVIIAGKKNEYDMLQGRMFRPTFPSQIECYKIDCYDPKRDVVHTIVYPKEGSPFNDEIEERYFRAAFENGDYEVVREQPLNERGDGAYIITNPYADLMGFVPTEREQLFHGPCCDRCQHRFGTTSNKHWCAFHWTNEKCYRFKLDKNT